MRAKKINIIMNEINKKELIGFFENYSVFKVKKNQVISENNNEIIWVKSGFVRLFKESKSKKETTLPVLRSAFYFSILNQLKNTGYKMEAINNLEVYRAPANEFFEFLDNNVELKNQVHSKIESILIETIDAYQKIVEGDAYTKIAILIRSMVDNESGDKRKNVEIKFAVPHRLLANMTGLTRETVTLQLLKMQKEGLIATNIRKLIIKDLDKLEELTNI